MPKLHSPLHCLQATKDDNRLTLEKLSCFGASRLVLDSDGATQRVSLPKNPTIAVSVSACSVAADWGSSALPRKSCFSYAPASRFSVSERAASAIYADGEHLWSAKIRAGQILGGFNIVTSQLRTDF